MNPTTKSDLPLMQQTWCDKVLLKRATPFLTYERFAQRRPLPTKAGETIKFRRYDPYPVAKTPLQEGVKPAGTKPSKVDILATPVQYGDYTELTDVVDLQSINQELTEAVELLGEQSGETVDEVCRDTLVGTASSYLANNVATRNLIVAIPTSNDLKRIERTLLGAKAKYHTQMVTASTGVGSSPIPPCFWVITHTDCKLDYEGVTGFVGVHEYSKQKEVLENEIGAIGNFRIVVTTKAPIVLNSGGTNASLISTPTNVDVYQDIILARDAYASIPLEGNALKTIIKALGSAGTADPLDQIQTAGWKAFQAFRIIQDLNMMRYEHGTTE